MDNQTTIGCLFGEDTISFAIQTYRLEMNLSRKSVGADFISSHH